MDLFTVLSLVLIVGTLSFIAFVLWRYYQDKKQTKAIEERLKAQALELEKARQERRRQREKAEHEERVRLAMRPRKPIGASHSPSTINIPAPVEYIPQRTVNKTPDRPHRESDSGSSLLTAAALGLGAYALLHSDDAKASSSSDSCSAPSDTDYGSSSSYDSGGGGDFSGGGSSDSW